MPLTYGVTVRVMMFDFTSVLPSDLRACIEYLPGLLKSYSLLKALFSTKALPGPTRPKTVLPATGTMPPQDLILVQGG